MCLGAHGDFSYIKKNLNSTGGGGLGVTILEVAMVDLICFLCHHKNNNYA